MEKNAPSQLNNWFVRYTRGVRQARTKITFFKPSDIISWYTLMYANVASYVTKWEYLFNILFDDLMNVPS